MAEGNAEILMPVHAELTTQRAAELTGVSGPFLIGLVEKGDFPYHEVGTYRRVYYKDQTRQGPANALDELRALGQDPQLGL